jgi:hypothetical protein
MIKAGIKRTNKGMTGIGHTHMHAAQPLAFPVGYKAQRFVPSETGLMLMLKTQMARRLCWLVFSILQKIFFAG